MSVGGVNGSERQLLTSLIHACVSVCVWCTSCMPGSPSKASHWLSAHTSVVLLLDQRPCLQFVPERLSYVHMLQ